MEPAHPRRGRPRKFAGPSRAVTLTLPEAVIERLGAMDRDLSRAVVRLARLRTSRSRSASAELTQFGKYSVIVLSPTRALAQKTGIEFVPLPDGRALISFPEKTTIAEFELMVSDALADASLSAEDQSLFQELADILKSARRSADVTVLERSIIVFESRKGHHKRRSLKHS